MATETVVFTPQQMTVIVEHEKLINKVLKKTCELSTTDYCILRAIYLSGGEVTGVGFASFLLLKANSISTALTRLEKKGYIERMSDSEDRRNTRSRITPMGDSVVKLATAEVYGMLKETFWSEFTEGEIASAVSVAGPILSQENLEVGKNMRNYGSDQAAFPPEFIIVLKYIVQRWTAEVRKSAGMSLSEYQVIMLLSNAVEPLLPSDISRKLFLAPSLVSIYKDNLEQAGYLSSSQGEDGRNLELKCTEEGESLAALTTAKLTRLTAKIYACLDEETSRYLNEWHMRMYRDLMSSAFAYR